MDDRFLNQFTNDVNTRTEVLEFIHNFIANEAVKRVYERKDVSAVADAKELIDIAFEDLINRYAPKAPSPKSVNNAK